MDYVWVIIWVRRFYVGKAYFMTKAELDPISNADMHLFFEKGIRDRVCYISKRYSKT